MARHRKGKVMKKHYRTRSQRQVNALFLWRHSQVREGDDNMGWLAPVAVSERSAVIDLAIHAPQIWHMLAVVYCRNERGDEYREFAEYRADQLFAAKDIVSGEDQLEPLITATMREAEKGVNSNHIYARALVLRPWSRARPSLSPVMQRLRGPLGLTADELDWEDA